MATNEQIVRELLTTDVGYLMWVNIAGEGKLNYQGDTREYVASVIFPANLAKPIITKIQEYYNRYAEAKDKVRSLGVKRCDSEGKSAEDGDSYCFSFKTRTKFPDGKPKEVKVYNASNNVVDLNCAKVANGSRGAISGVMGFYRKGRDAGVSLYLNKVQIVEFIPYTGKDDNPFESHEGNFTGVPEDSFESNSEEATAKPIL